jgi:hypothetical protein
LKTDPESLTVSLSYSPNHELRSKKKSVKMKKVVLHCDKKSYENSINFLKCFYTMQKRRQESLAKKKKK